MTGRIALMEMLRAEGVHYVFGNPGSSEGPIMDALEGYPDLEYILVAQEGVAMGMADAYARATGRPAFLNLHIETGLTNGMSLLFNAYAGGTPLVLTSANADVSKLAADRTDLAGLVRPFTKWSVEITHAEQFPSVMRRAFQEARTPPTGPVYVAFAQDALDDEADVEIAPSSDAYVRTAPDPAGIEEAARLLAGARRPALLLGDRVEQYDGVAEAVVLAERLGARVYGASYPAVLFPTDHPQWVAQLPGYARFYREALGAADVVLAVGCKVFHDFFLLVEGVQAPGARLIQIDCNAGEIGQSHPIDLGILADPKVALAALTEALGEAMSDAQQAAARSRAEEIAAETRARRHAFRRRVDEARDHRPMRPELMMTELAAALPPDVVVVDDAVTSQPALHGAMRFSRPGGVLAGRAGGALGWGMGAGLGAKLAHPDRPVVTVLGDGSAMMTVQALWTAAAYKIPVVYLVCNNASYRVLKVNLRHYFREVLGQSDKPSKYIGMDFPRPFDLAAIARGMGVAAERIEDPQAIGPAVARALDSGAPALLDVVIDGSL